MDTPGNRIKFFGNPWPEGHPLLEFEWIASERRGEVWFDLHLKTAEYEFERSINAEDEAEDPPDWEAPAVWNNFHACILSSNYWHAGGFPIGKVGKVSLESLDGMTVSVDDPPPEDIEECAFHVYLLGHDATAYHRITFSRLPGTDRFDICWTGRLALAYVGDYEYKHAFEVKAFNVQAPKLPGV